MKKISILLVVLSLLSCSVLGETKEIFDGWLYSGNTTTIDGENFTMDLGSRFDKMYLKLPTGNSVIVKNESCDTKDYYTVCYNGTREGYHDYFRDVIVMEAHIMIEQTTAKVNISRNVQKTDLLIGEEARIITKIMNDGERDATNVVFNDEFSEDFDITYVEGCVIYGNKIEWKGDLKRSEEKECQYRIKPLKEVTYDSKSTVSYNNGEKEVTESSSTTKMTAKKPSLDINTSINKTVLDLGGEFWLNITLKNTGSDDIRIDDFVIDIPDDAEVTEKRWIDSDKLYWKGTLKGGEDKEMRLKIKIKKTGNRSIWLNTDYTVDSIRGEDKREVEVITNDVVSPSILFIGLEDGSKTDGKKNIEVYVENLDEKVSFYNVKTTIKQIDLPLGLKEIVEELAAKRHVKVGDLEVIGKELGNYTIKGVVRAETEYGEMFEKEFTKVIELVEKTEVGAEEKSKVEEKAEEGIIERNVNLGGNTYKVAMTKESLIFGVPLIFVIIMAIRHIIKKRKEKKYQLEV